MEVRNNYTKVSLLQTTNSMLPYRRLFVKSERSAQNYFIFIYKEENFKWVNC